MLTLMHRTFRHPWTEESGYVTNTYVTDTEEERDTDIKRFQVLGWKVWISGTHGGLNKPAFVVYKRFEIRKEQSNQV